MIVQNILSGFSWNVNNDNMLAETVPLFDRMIRTSGVRRREGHHYGSVTDYQRVTVKSGVAAIFGVIRKIFPERNMVTGGEYFREGINAFCPSGHNKRYVFDIDFRKEQLLPFQITDTWISSADNCQIHMFTKSSFGQALNYVTINICEQM